MKLLLDIEEEKAPFIMELLKNFNFVKTSPLTPYKGEVLENVRDAVKEVNQVKAGRQRAQSLREFLDEV